MYKWYCQNVEENDIFCQYEWHARYDTNHLGIAKNHRESSKTVVQIQKKVYQKAKKNQKISFSSFWVKENKRTAC